MSEKQAMKAFYDRVGANYPEEDLVYHTLRGMLRKKFIVNWLSQQSGSLLEIGTNRGMYLQLYNGGPRFGTDLSLPALQHADQRKPVDLFISDAENLGLAENVFDHILCSEVIEHVFHPQKIFSGIAGALKLGGTALITTPNFKGERPTWIKVGEMEQFGIEGDWGDEYFHTAFKPHEMAEMAKRAGLHVVESGTLEKEVKWAAKVPAAILLLLRQLNRLFKSTKLGHANERFFQHFQVVFYQFFAKIGCAPFFNRFIREGVRSFVIVRKS